MEKKILYWLDGELMGERTEDEVEEIVKMAEAAGYAIHRRPGHILVYTAEEGEKDNQGQQEEIPGEK